MKKKAEFLVYISSGRNQTKGLTQECERTNPVDTEQTTGKLYTKGTKREEHYTDKCRFKTKLAVNVIPPK